MIITLVMVLIRVALRVSVRGTEVTNRCTGVLCSTIILIVVLRPTTQAREDGGRMSATRRRIVALDKVAAFSQPGYVQEGYKHGLFLRPTLSGRSPVEIDDGGEY